MTYLEAVTDLLFIFLDSHLYTLAQTTYSAMIGKLVNDSKRRVEDAFNWNSLKSTLVIPTVNGTSTYSLTGMGQRFKVLSIINDTDDYHLQPISASTMESYRYLGSQTNGEPAYYTFDGVDASGDTKVTVYPTPDSVQSLRFNLIVPQNTLTSESTMILVPSDPVVLGAYTVALAERGEDQGIASSEATMMYRAALGDAISIESSRHCEYDSWSAV